ncbi:DUF5677 domain-containing protein [Nocardia rhamnosiphila]|uniref:DUF5677 domain-containing protein n=1 Tax=Nocardia rhamnosiphila TaxID=426716 RepID=UPI0033EDC8C5
MSTLTASEYAQISRKLIAQFDEHIGRDSLRLETAGNRAALKAGVVLGLAVHVHKLSRVVLDLLEGDTPSSLVVPTLRTCFEASLTAHWVAQSVDAAAALFNEEFRQRRAIQQTMTTAQSSSTREAAVRVAHADSPDSVTSSTVQARHFEQRLKDFEGGGPDIYVLFRRLSTFSHAGASLIDLYHDNAPDDSEHLFTLRLDPKPPFPPEFCTSMIGCCLVWAGAAVCLVQQDADAWHFELRAAAAELDTLADIPLSADARRRQNLPTAP